MSSILHKELTGSILKLFYEVYNELGYGKGNYLLTTGRMRDDEVLIRCERSSGHAF